jgi:DNA repair exonuclease SbcCD ATPase subunit
VKDKHVLRVKSIKLCRFRGFVSATPIELNTDADIVLITGPNGFGKTSLMDALCLLLNRHFYPEKLPLSSCNKEKYDETFIEAVIEYTENESDVVKVHIEENSKKQPKITPSKSPWMGNISSELAARCSFFYQDLLDKLFEEEEAQVRLLEFLSPTPENVLIAQNAVKQVQNEWKRYSDALLGNFTMDSLPNESTINEKRREVVAVFKETWNKLVKIVKTEMRIALPEISENWLYLKDLKNLRAGWESELRNFVSECLNVLMPDEKKLAVNEKPSLILQFIEKALSQLRYKTIHQTAETKDRLKLFLNSIANSVQLFPPSIWSEKEKEINKLSKEVQELKMHLELLEKLERHFDNPEGPNLMEVLIALRDQGKIWLKIPSKISSDVRPPLLIIEWLQKTVTDDFSKLVEDFESWQSTISQQRFELQQKVFEKQQEMQNQNEFLKKSREVFELLEQSGLNAELKDFFNSNLPIASSKIKEKVLGSVTMPIQLYSAIEDAQKVISEWIQIEEQNERRLSYLQQERNYLKVKEYIEIVSEALKEETGKNSVLNTALFPSSGILEELKKNINEILERFRIVEGICPVCLQTQRGKSAKSGILQICAADGRPLKAFSTGQKAQLGLALLIGLNYSLNKYIGHNIIALDDVTTVFDMAQLPRTAALIRQIAYAPGEVCARRQVFIVSHHEDLTNRLLDFLIPPEGRELRILNFINWTQSNGPEVEQRRAIPGLKVCKDSRKKLAHVFDTICKRNY